MSRKLTISVFKNHNELEEKDINYWKKQTPEARLDALEILRLQAGKFLYAYPTRLRRIITITGKTQG